MKYLISLLIIFTITIQAQTTVTINPEQQYQEVEGWGSSLIWWANMIGQWDNEEKIDSIVKLLTSPEELNMNIFRYNIGGGDHPSHYSTPEQKGHMAKGKGVRAEMQGFLDSTNANYNWSNDAGQRKIMLKIKEQRPDVVFEAFSNSPPYWMTYSGCSAGNNDPSTDNLKPEYYEAFCDYLIDVCLHYKKEYGIEFKTLEPFNEPQTSYWNYKGSQEGCHFDIETQIKIVKILYPKLKASGLNTVISASDETSVKSFNKAMNAYIKAGITPLIGQINTHTYDVDKKDRIEALRISKVFGVPFWQSETGPIGIKGKNFVNNLGLAERLILDMKDMQANAWLDWQIMEEHNNTWGLIRGSFANENFTLIKNFYVRKQVTKFIKQGYIIINSDDDHTLAAISTNKKEIVIVTINKNEEDQDITYTLPKEYKIKNIKSYITSESKNVVFSKNYTVTRNKIKNNAKAKSIQTYIISIE